MFRYSPFPCSRIHARPQSDRPPRHRPAHAPPMCAYNVRRLSPRRWRRWQRLLPTHRLQKPLSLHLTLATAKGQMMTSTSSSMTMRALLHNRRQFAVVDRGPAAGQRRRRRSSCTYHANAGGGGPAMTTTPVTPVHLRFHTQAECGRRGYGLLRRRRRRSQLDAHRRDPSSIELPRNHCPWRGLGSGLARVAHARGRRLRRVCEQGEALGGRRELWGFRWVVITLCLCTTPFTPASWRQQFARTRTSHNYVCKANAIRNVSRPTRFVAAPLQHFVVCRPRLALFACNTLISVVYYVQRIGKTR